MNVKKFKNNKIQKLSNFILNQNLGLSYSFIQKLIRNKDVKVNGKRVGNDVFLDVEDNVLIFLKPSDGEFNLKVLYEDENIVVIFKPRNIETISEYGNDLNFHASNYVKGDCFAVHRLDRNTEGLIIFAKNIQSKNELDIALKNRTLEKFYLAHIYGLFSKNQDQMVAYLKKDSKNSVVSIVDEPKKGYLKIQTNYKVLKEFENSTLVEVELVTGRTHQIRAHFAHIGHFVIGDEKYGDSNINKLYKKKYQDLCAYKIIFHFDGGFLNYLDKKEISLNLKDIDFCKNI